MREPRAGYGYGILEVYDGTMKQVTPLITIAKTDTQGYLKEQGVFEQLKQALLLPADYQIHGVFFEVWKHTWNILLEAPGVPEVEEGALAPKLIPTLQRTYHEETGAYETLLLRIEIENGPEKKVIFERPGEQQGAG